MKDLKEQIFGPSIPPKKLYGRVLNGEMLVGLVSVLFRPSNSICVYMMFSLTTYSMYAPIVFATDNSYLG